jgi:nucleotide-binding universal stress UspA family protein
MFNRVVAAYDGSETSLAAARWAASEAERRESVLRIVTCFTVPLLAGDPHMTTDEIDRQRLEATKALASLRLDLECEYPDLKIDTDLVVGQPGHVLVDEGLLADIVVMGTVGRKRTLSWRVGSTTRRITRHCHQPVIAVPAEASPGPPQRVLVGLDGSSANQAALKWAAAQSDRNGSALIVMRPHSRIDLLDSVEPGDLVVVGARVHGAIAHALSGSQTDALLEHSPVPVVVVNEMWR